jgi:hypothetical protein
MADIKGMTLPQMRLFVERRAIQKQMETADLLYLMALASGQNADAINEVIEKLRSPVVSEPTHTPDEELASIADSQELAKDGIFF